METSPVSGMVNCPVSGMETGPRSRIATGLSPELGMTNGSGILGLELQDTKMESEAEVRNTW